MQSHAQRLLELPGTHWRDLPRRFPVTSLILAGLLPNAAMSGLNITYNWNQIVRNLPDADRQAFVFLLMAVNAIAYAWGTLWALYLSWPVVVAMWEVTGRGRDRWRPPTPHWLPSLRVRALRLGEYAAWVSAVDWAFSGFVIPTWMRTQAGEHTAMMGKDYLHFAVSQALCGLIAATLTFFLVTLAAVRTCYPRLMPPANECAAASSAVPPPAAVLSMASEAEDPSPTIVRHPSMSSETSQVPASAAEASDAGQLLALGRRVWICFGLAAAVPLLAVMLLAGLDDAKAAIGGLLVAGLIGSGISFGLALMIRRDLSALATASQSIGDVGPNSHDPNHPTGAASPS